MRRSTSDGTFTRSAIAIVGFALGLSLADVPIHAGLANIQRDSMVNAGLLTPDDHGQTITKADSERNVASRTPFRCIPRFGLP